MKYGIGILEGSSLTITLLGLLRHDVVIALYGMVLMQIGGLALMYLELSRLCRLQADLLETLRAILNQQLHVNEEEEGDIKQH